MNAAWWPFGLPYWPLDRLLGSVAAWNLFTLLALFAAGLLAMLWLLELELSLLAAAAGGLAFEIAPYRVMQSRGHLLGPTSLLLALALWGFERARATGRWWWWAISWLALASIPLSGQVHLALGAIPFYVLYALCRSTARSVVVGTGVGAIVAVLAGVLIRQTVIAGSIDSGGRSLAGTRVLGDRARLLKRPPGTASGVRLPRVADAAARDRRTRLAAHGTRAAARGSAGPARSCRCCWLSAPLPPLLAALARVLAAALSARTGG